jgi:hypothetical protein
MSGLVAKQERRPPRSGRQPRRMRLRQLLRQIGRHFQASLPLAQWDAPDTIGRGRYGSHYEGLSPVILNGTVAIRADKRCAEDVAKRRPLADGLHSAGRRRRKAVAWERKGCPAVLPARDVTLAAGSPRETR